MGDGVTAQVTPRRQASKASNCPDCTCPDADVGGGGAGVSAVIHLVRWSVPEEEEEVSVQCSLSQSRDDTRMNNTYMASHT